jgi:hypothetical protein
MVRAIDKDFRQLQEYFTKYDLNHIAKNPSQLATVRAAHKAYLPFLQFWAIVSSVALKGGLKIYGVDLNVTSAQYAHLMEAVSDVGSGLFCCLHGAYKPGHMSLRSSIENFLRFAGGAFDPKALQTTSVYTLFALSKNTPAFANTNASYLIQLRSMYVELCKFSHSATLAHMAGIHALAHFPSFDEPAFQGWIRMAKECMTAMMAVALLGQPSLYSGAHFSAREVLDTLLPEAERLRLIKGHRPAK